MPTFEERYASSPAEAGKMTTSQLRENFLGQQLFRTGDLNFIYSHFDRMIAGGIVPQAEPISLPTFNALKADFFLQRREMGIINIGGKGKVDAGKETYTLEKTDCLYLGKGTENVKFTSYDAANPAKFYILSAPAHHNYPNTFMAASKATPAALGALETSNERTIYKYIHEDGIKSCQLVMGLTILKNGSVWNTMPPHTHNRRMEMYLYFDVPAEHRVFHFMGEATETRHMVVANEELIISAPWSVHSGCGTSAYAFIWGMAGENQSFADMDAIAIKDLQ